MLSSLSALAEVPNRIEALFNTKTVNDAGIYSVNFFVNGIRQEVVIDDYVPCDPETQLPCFAYSQHYGEIWATLLEKAWAKLHGSYCMIRRGSTLSAMPHLTGAPSIRVDHNLVKSHDDYWKQLCDSVRRQYVVSACTQETDLTEQASGTKRGTISGHAYSVLATHEVTQGRAKVKLVKLRNPWGVAEWSGDWSNESDKWTPQLRQELGAEEVAQTGIFFISFEDFVEHFRCTTINFVSGDERQGTVKTTSMHYDFSAQDDQSKNYQLA